jgi:hypothetical protein
VGLLRCDLCGGKMMSEKDNTSKLFSILMVWMLVIVGFVGINFVVDEVSANEQQKERNYTSKRALANSPWPSFRGNAKNTGLSPYDTSGNNGTQRWNFTTGDLVHSSPTISSDGTIYVGSHDYKLYAINFNGTEKWNFTTGYAIISSPALDSSGTIYV